MELSVELRLQNPYDESILLLSPDCALLEISGMSPMRHVSFVRVAGCCCALVTYIELNTLIQFGESIAMELCR